MAEKTIFSRKFESKLYALVAEHYADIGKFFREHKDLEQIDDRKATLILMWYIRTFVMMSWKGQKVVDVLDNIKKVVIEQEGEELTG